MLLSPCLMAKAAGDEAKKEEVIYVNLTSYGQVDAAYAVNIFPDGAVTDYGDYTSVRIMNTGDKLNYAGGLMIFVSAESRDTIRATWPGRSCPGCSALLGC